MLLMKVKNLTGEPVLGSVVVELPKSLSLDDTGMHAAKELRLGTLSPRRGEGQPRSTATSARTLVSTLFR